MGVIKSDLRCHGSLYSHGVGGAALPLSPERCKMPDVAATVDLETTLRPHSEALAKQAAEPTQVLLRPRDRPLRLPRPFVMADRSCPTLVKRGVQAGLMRLVPSRRVIRQHGKPVYNGSFAVGKDASEDRIISAMVPTNSLLNPGSIPRPRFAYPPKLRVLRTAAGERVVVWKRDARHYFHQLKVGRRWKSVHHSFHHGAEHPDHGLHILWVVPQVGGGHSSLQMPGASRRTRGAAGG